MWLIIIFLVLLLLCIYVLTAPFYFGIDSEERVIWFRFHRFSNGAVTWKNDTFIFQIRVAWWEKDIDLFVIKKKKKVKKKTRPKRKRNVRFNIGMKQMIAVMKSFTLTRCKIKIDTGDNPLNGMLFPVFYWIGRRIDEDISVNFMDENIFIIETRNSFAKMIWAYFRA